MSNNIGLGGAIEDEDEVEKNRKKNKDKNDPTGTSGVNRAIAGVASGGATEGAGAFFGDKARKALTGEMASDYLANMGKADTIKYTAEKYDPTAVTVGAGVDTSKYDAAAGNVGNIGANQTTSAQIDTTGQAANQAAQTQALQELQLRAQGKGGPSPAELQMMQALNRSINAQRSQASSAKGMTSAQAARMAGQNIGTTTADIAGQGTLLRATEQMQAQKSLADLATQGRGQDIGLASQQAQLQEQTNLANLAAAGDWQKVQQTLIAQYTQMGLDLAKAQAQADIDIQKMKSDQQTAANQTNADIAKANAEAKSKAKAGALGAIGTLGGAVIGALSDVRAKKDIRKPSDKEIEQFLNALQAYTFKYKNQKDGQGKQLGVMAQDLENSKIGKDAVYENDGMKNIDLMRLLPSALATISNLNERLKEIESKKRG